MRTGHRVQIGCHHSIYQIALTILSVGLGWVFDASSAHWSSRVSAGCLMSMSLTELTCLDVDGGLPCSHQKCQLPCCLHEWPAISQLSTRQGLVVGWVACQLKVSRINEQFCLRVKSVSNNLQQIISIESGASQAISTLCLGSIMRMVLTVTFMEL